MPIDFSELALSPNESRAARNYFGLSQVQAAAKSNLPVHKLKRFETGTYVPDNEFLQQLREFFEGEGYNFHDENAPGAKAKARGDIFQAGVVGDTTGATGESAGSPSGKLGKLPRPQTANLQFMRITPTLESDQVDRVFSRIDENIEFLEAAGGKGVTWSGWDGAPNKEARSQTALAIRHLAEIGLLYAYLQGREILPMPVDPEPGQLKDAATVGDMLCLSMADLQMAVINDSKDAYARLKARAEPEDMLQALVG